MKAILQILATYELDLPPEGGTDLDIGQLDDRLRLIDAAIVSFEPKEQHYAQAHREPN